MADSTSYENMNMDHIAKLSGEGYATDAVIRALGISRNDVEMARDILNEFGSKGSSGGGNLNSNSGAGS